MEEILNQNLQINNFNSLKEEQNNFLNTMLGKTINTAFDIGIRAIFPEFVEEQVINLKDNLLKYGLKQGIQETINNSIDLGKSALGIVTGNFESVEQMQSAVKSGGIIDGLSSLLDYSINKATEKGAMNNNVSTILLKGKDAILNNIESNIQKSFEIQLNNKEKLDGHIESWEKFYKNKDFENMEKEYKEIKKEIKKLIPVEKTLNEARTIENLHNLIKNNGQDFNLSEEQLELAKNLK